MKYRVIVAETQHYELFVEADDIDEAEDIALEEYGCNGTIFATYANVAHIDKSEKYNN